MKIEKKAKGKGKGKGKAIIAIAMAAIMLASLVALVPTAIAVAPEVTVDKIWQNTPSATPLTYTFSVKNIGTATDAFWVTYSVPSAGWTYSAPLAPFTIAPQGTFIFTLTVAPPALPTTPTFDTCTVTVIDSAGTGITTLPVRTYVVHGRYNVIAATVPGATPPAQAVLIGQHLDLIGCSAWGANAVIKGAPGSAVEGEMFTADSTGHFDTSVMAKTGTYFVNPDAMCTFWEAQLAV